MKFEMKTFLVLYSLTFAGSAFAISDDKLIEKCTPAAIEEIYRLAKQRGCTVVNDDIILTGIDNRMMNPSKYLNYTYSTKCEGLEGVQERNFIAQHYGGKCYVSNK